MAKKLIEASYPAPELEVHQVAAEAGFAQSLPTQEVAPPDFNWDETLS